MADAGDDGHPVSVTAATLKGYDVIVAQRWNKHTGLGVWRGARTPYSRLVYELDDDLWNITPENWNAYRLYNDPEIRDAAEHSAETADLVTVTTAPLAEVMRQFNGNVAVLPNAIPDWVLQLPRLPESLGRTRPRVGWQGGGSHGIDIGQVASPVRRFLKRFPAWDLQLNGTDYRPTFRAPAARAFYAPWVPVCGAARAVLRHHRLRHRPRPALAHHLQQLEVGDEGDRVRGAGHPVDRHRLPRLP